MPRKEAKWTVKWGKEGRLLAGMASKETVSGQDSYKTG
jgi:hypothetical protein